MIVTAHEVPYAFIFQELRGISMSPITVFDIAPKEAKAFLCFVHSSTV